MYRYKCVHIYNYMGEEKRGFGRFRALGVCDVELGWSDPIRLHFLAFYKWAVSLTHVFKVLMLLVCRLQKKFGK